MAKKPLIILSIVILALIFFTGISVNKKSASFCLALIGNYFKKDLTKENIVLKAEKEDLRAQIQRINSFCINVGADYQIKEKNKSQIIANVFSTYPLNFKNILVIDKGSNDGVEKEMIALWQENILLGNVEEIKDNYANIKTFFNPGVQISVKIGDEKINGLLKGGGDPQIELIEKPVKVGDAVFSASSDFPIGLKIGEIKEIKETSGAIFGNATVKFPYNIGEIEAVILTK